MRFIINFSEHLRLDIKILCSTESHEDRKHGINHTYDDGCFVCACELVVDRTSLRIAFTQLIE